MGVPASEELLYPEGKREADLPPLLSYQGARDCVPCPPITRTDYVTELNPEEVASQKLPVQPAIVTPQEGLEEGAEVNDPVGVSAVEEDRLLAKVLAPEEVQNILDPYLRVKPDLELDAEGHQLLAQIEEGQHHLLCPRVIKDRGEALLNEGDKLLGNNRLEPFPLDLLLLLPKLQEQLAGHLGDQPLPGHQEVSARLFSCLPLLSQGRGLPRLIVEI